MIDLELEPQLDHRTVYVQDEPALEIALPQVFEQPVLGTLQRSKLPSPEALVAQLYRRHQADPGMALGPDYQELVLEFQPLFAWTIACWDYLLSTEGCRFLPRHSEQRSGYRGDYRAFADKDYSRMVHAAFRRCVFAFAQAPVEPSLGQWLRERLWPLILETYRQLENPPDPRQRKLTPYSYLRCVPYRFLNDYHHERVHRRVERLSRSSQRAINSYFLHFCTEAASAQELGVSIEEFLSRLRQGLLKLLIDDRLVYCLLRQIERY